MKVVVQFGIIVKVNTTLRTYGSNNNYSVEWEFAKRIIGFEKYFSAVKTKVDI